MSSALHRTTFEFKPSGSNSGLDTGTWIINPDMSATLDVGVPRKYWKLSGDNVLEMTGAEKDIVDQAATDATNAATEASIVARAVGEDPLSGVNWSVVATGLSINTIIGDIVDDTTVVTADPFDTKCVKVAYVWDSAGDILSVAVFEKTTGAYSELGADEVLIRNLQEFSVIANGTDLEEIV